MFNSSFLTSLRRSLYSKLNINKLSRSPQPSHLNLITKVLPCSWWFRRRFRLRPPVATVLQESFDHRTKSHLHDWVWMTARHLFLKVFTIMIDTVHLTNSDIQSTDFLQHAINTLCRKIGNQMFIRAFLSTSKLLITQYRWPFPLPLL